MRGRGGARRLPGRAHAGPGGCGPLLPDARDARLTRRASRGRRAAWEAIRASHRGRRLDLAFAETASDLDTRERGFALELAYGTVRLRGRWDHLLARHLSRELDALDPELLDLLRLGAHQLLAMRVPAWAAISESVELAREVGAGRAAGLVNAVLRALSRDDGGAERWPDPDRDPVGFLSTWGSHPRWLVERWLARWSFDEVRALVEFDNAVPPLRIVPADGDLTAAAAAFAREGVEVETELIPGTLRVTTSDVPRALSIHPGFVQDAGAALVVRFAAVRSGDRVADLCAAPGGKALSAARVARYVLAADPSEPRLALVRESARRLGLPVHVVRARGEDPPVSELDLVLVDAPCTGTGTLRRHPDARWRLEPEAPARMAEVQARILLGSADVVRPGGHLVYSTCTLEPEENEGVIARVLAKRPDFTVDPPDDPALPMREGALEVLPQREGWDGAWAMRLRRNPMTMDET
ncbi:MAG: transcription antitermination factor NusB [Longimicrobiales bacterium]|nr:transcription antitermination factor NusB [Longimicrobiales bacterium]